MKFIFLTYVSRSGSTFLANLLDSSPMILACPEGDSLISLLLEDPARKFEFYDRIRSRFIKAFSADPKLKNWGDWESFLNNLESAKNNLDAFKAILVNYKDHVKPGAEFILFKAERFISLISKIRKANTRDDIKFISIIRDPRAVFGSQKKTMVPETGKIMSEDPVRTSLFWKGHVRKSLRDLNKGRLYFISYENLILKNQIIIGQISKILGVSPSEIKSGEGKLYERLSLSHRKIHANCIKQPDATKISEWEKILDRKELQKIEFLTSRFMKRLGYERKVKKHNFIMIFAQTFPAISRYYSGLILQKLLFHMNA